MRKPHPSAVLKRLPDEDQAELFDFLRTHTLAEAVPWVFSEHGVRTNDSSLSEWRGWYQMRQEITAWNDDVETLKATLRADTDMPDNLIAKVGEAVFLGRSAKQGDAKTFALVASIIQRSQELEANKSAHQDKMALKDREIQLKAKAQATAERKLEQAERRIRALEEAAEQTRLAAERAKEAVKSGAGMDEATRAKLIAEMDHLILGRPKPTGQAST